MKEIKHKEKTPYIAEKSYKAKKQTKKENPLIKRKSVVINDNIPKFLPSKPSFKPLTKNKKNLKAKTNIKRKLKSPVKPKIKPKKIIAKIKEKPKPKLKNKLNKKNIIKKYVSKKNKKNTIVSLNKINPSLQDILNSSIAKEIRQVRKDNNSSKSNPLGKQASILQPNIFKPSHVYPDDIDISDSISISTQSSRYASYLHKVKRKIELVWEYPKIAGEMGIQGRLFLKFEIDRSGKLKMIKLLKSSGAKILDEEAIRAVKEAAPYPPFPKDFKIKSIKIHACFDYILIGKEIW